MYGGRAVETGTVDEIFYASRHPYTLGLLASLPRVDDDETSGRLYRIKGQPPSLVFLPSGCAFHPRCDFAQLPAPCATVVPALRIVQHEYATHMSACHFAETLVDTSVAALHAEPGAELEMMEDAAAPLAAELAAVESLSKPTEGEA
jgi:oligopeptide/dipeptide ABC transporter ATP-binding protein